MREWNQGVQKRREERVRAIRMGRGESSSYREPGIPVWKKEASGKSEDLPWNRPQWTKSEGKKKKEGRLLLQTFVAFILFTGTYLIFQSQAPSGQAAQTLIAEVMERDYNFAGVARWYENTIGESPSILPAFKNKKDTSMEKKKSWVAPVKGKQVTTYSKKDRGVFVQTGKGAPVVAVAEGWVVKADTEEGLGKTVIIRHKDGRETWYGGMNTLRVKKKDWVKPSQLLGETTEKSGDSLLFFALKEKGAFVDPTGVVSFD
ncbi:stage IV sporulation protein FA [Marininema mesophilum]|uniref:Stage IV sporulation protein FA n=1 Tax=Marininema mesophilum TaxID=1048340 RepID=A0A1H2S403_9BACL|nr:M23 family metallopeptidase [Marininema mesophilum]SDW26341.1 stage IV sporulation protein FA [Marininema mesophilum]